MPRVQKIMGFAEAPRSRRRSLAQRGERRAPKWGWCPSLWWARALFGSAPNIRGFQPPLTALPTVAKLIRGFDGIVQKSRILPHAVGLEWQGFSEDRTV
jgi:hypothetical protein